MTCFRFIYSPCPPPPCTAVKHGWYCTRWLQRPVRLPPDSPKVTDHESYIRLVSSVVFRVYVAKFFKPIALNYIAILTLQHFLGLHSYKPVIRYWVKVVRERPPLWAWSFHYSIPLFHSTESRRPSCFSRAMLKSWEGLGMRLYTNNVEEWVYQTNYYAH